MAVATPILERPLEETQEAVRNEYVVAKNKDELHNSRINDIYQKLINPETKMSDMRTIVAPAEPAPVQAVEPVTVQPVEEVQEEGNRLVDSARTSSILFRADSAINKKVTVIESKVGETAIERNIIEPDEDDAVPTRTTMQYSTEAMKADAEGAIINKSAEKRLNLTKRDKVVIAVVVSVIVALFALIIINSAIISGVNSQISTMQSSLNTARGAYYDVTGKIADYEANLEEILQALADSLGMIK